MINNNSPLHSTLSDGLPAPVHAGDFVLDCAIEAGLLPSHHFFGVRLDLMLEELHGAMAQYEPSDPRVQGCLRALKCGPLRGGALAAADAREIERFVDRLRSNRPEQGRALAAADAREIERFVDRLRSRHLPLKASLLLRDMVPDKGIVHLLVHPSADRSACIDIYRSLHEPEGQRLAFHLRSVLGAENKSWTSGLQAFLLGLLLRHLDRVPLDQITTCWESFFERVNNADLSPRDRVNLLGKMISKASLLRERVQNTVRGDCLTQLVDLSKYLRDDSTSRELLLKALERLPANKTFLDRMEPAVVTLLSNGLAKEALAWIAHVTNRMEDDGSKDWRVKLANMVFRVFDFKRDMEGQPWGEVLFAKLSSQLFARKQDDDTRASLLRFAQASGGLHHLASMAEVALARKEARRLATAALTNSAAFARLPHVTRLLKREQLAPALRACAAIRDPELRYARLSEFQTDCAERNLHLAAIADKLRHGVALESVEQSVLDDSEPEKLLGRKTQRDKGGPP